MAEQGITGANVGVIVSADVARTRAYIDAATAPNTRRAYRSDWEHFTCWCATHELLSLPATPETVALYLAALAQVAKVSTVGRRLTAIAKAHRAAGYETPTKSEAVHLTMRGIRRTHGVAPNQKAPAVLADLRAIARSCSSASPAPSVAPNWYRSMSPILRLASGA